MHCEQQSLSVYSRQGGVCPALSYFIIKPSAIFCRPGAPSDWVTTDMSTSPRYFPTLVTHVALYTSTSTAISQPYFLVSTAGKREPTSTVSCWKTITHCTPCTLLPVPGSKHLEDLYMILLTNQHRQQMYRVCCMFRCLQHAYRVPLKEETEESCSGSNENQSATSSLASNEN